MRRRVGKRILTWGRPGGPPRPDAEAHGRRPSQRHGMRNDDGRHGNGWRHEPDEASPDRTCTIKATVARSRTLGPMLRPTGRGLSRSGKTTRTGRAAAPGSEGGKLALNLVGVTIRALQFGVGVFHPTQHLERFAAAAALVFIKGHHELLVLAKRPIGRSVPTTLNWGCRRNQDDLRFQKNLALE